MGLDWNQAMMIGVVIVVILLCLICGILRERNRLFTLRVKKGSRRYKALIELNSRYRFHEDIRECYQFDYHVDTKLKYDRFDFDKAMRAEIEGDIAGCRRLIARVRENQRLFSWYCNEIAALPDPITRKESEEQKVPYSFYREKENAFCEQAYMRPVLTPEWICKVYYRSLHGRNSYRKRIVYSFEELMDLCGEVQRRQEYRQTAEYQRRKMTDSIRYDILKRDGFRCTICGRTAGEGVRLHVDHIIPVSKGGKTEYSNLRTLCEACNLGKRDKYDPFGVN